LHPLIDRRDILSIAQANLSSSLQSTLRDKTVAEVDNLRTLEQNRELTASLHVLTTELQARQDSVLANSSLSAQLDQAREDQAIARKRWRIMKTVVSAIIAGSGVDWARNGALRDLALDEEDEAD
jgi:hypothetical protein